MVDVVHLIASAEAIHRIGGDIPRFVDGHYFGARRIHGIDDVAEFARQPTRTEIDEAIKEFIGEITQTPSQYSAIKIKGLILIN